jgi:DNA-binding LytR/AlgR family response regulator
VDAFDVEAADYVLKPLRLDRLRRAIDRVRRRREQLPSRTSPGSAQDEAFWVQGRHGLVRVGLAEIDWVEAAKDYVLLHTPVRSHILRTTMAAIEAKVAPISLVRVHRSAFVRPGAVQCLQRSASGGAALVLVDGTAIPVGPSYLPDIERIFD